MYGLDHETAREIRILTAPETIGELDEKRYRKHAKSDRESAPVPVSRYTHDIRNYWKRLATA